MKRRRTITFEKTQFKTKYLGYFNYQAEVISDSAIISTITEICEALEIKLIKIQLSNCDDCKIILKCTPCEKTNFLNLLTRQLQNKIQNLKG